MGGSGRAQGKGPRVCRTLLLLLLLLLWEATATGLGLEGSPTSWDGMHMEEESKIKKNSLLTLLAQWHEWTSRSSPGDLAAGDAAKVAKRKEGAPLQQPPRRDQKRCRNFFWKTFSCK